MKRQLLLGTALLAAISAFSQASKHKPLLIEDNVAERLASKYRILDNPVEGTSAINAPASVNSADQANYERSSLVSPISWQYLSGSMNIFGVLVSDSKPLQYNNELKTVSFVHRKSFTYVPNPVATPSTAASGCIVMQVSNDWGATWDSTLLWNNNTQNARYPQGGIYNPPGNTSLANAYGVVTGPITTGSGWIGSYLASKQLDIAHGLGYDNVASTAPNAQQFYANTPPYSALKKFDFPRTDFSATDDGVVRTTARINANGNGTTFATIGYRGVRILKGSFSSGVFSWSSDSIIPPNISNGNGFKNIAINADMAWNETGTVGYVVFIGTDTTRTLSNRGFQPIIYKTTNSGASWTSVTGIDFNSPAMAQEVLKYVPPVQTNTNFVIPRFSANEGMDIIVDGNDRLHIVSTIEGSPKAHRDSSLNGAYTFTNADGEKYSFGHTPGSRPYIFDFYETATSWSVAIVDSMSTEGPGTASGDDGLNDNPWDVDAASGTKVPCDARIQLSRTPDGKFVVYTWAETDTFITNSFHKWNSNPNIKARVMDISTAKVNSVEINVTNPSTFPGHPAVKSSAYMHYISPRCDYTFSFTVNNPTATIGGPILRVPMTVSNSSPLLQGTANRHWYTSADLYFGTLNDVGVSENVLTNVQNSFIYPNPAASAAYLKIGLNDNAKVNISVYNTVGQVVKTSSANGNVGENTISIDLNGISTGIYMVTVKVGNASTTKKLIVE